MKNFKCIWLVLIVFMLYQFSNAQNKTDREFRGVWIATVENIDWPSSKDLSTKEQKKEIIQLLDLYKSLNFNAIIFQIRPSADAFYNSRYEPWSSYLTGTNDKVPTPYYDPLAFIITETHKRGMEFHAWLNPYRAIVNYKEFHSNPFRLTYEKPEWFINYGKNKYFNPGIPEVRKYTNKIVEDIVQNYDVDAIHFDDYFYPYKIKDENFSDEVAFKTYGGDYYPNNLDDWRRNNVNLIIEELYTTIKTIKPWVQFGISPFGVWRNKSVDPKGSDTDAGQTNYDDLYADVLLWINKGWLDYILPQAYWHIGHKKANYATIVEWWAENSQNVNLYIGQGAYRLDRKKEHRAWKKKKPTEIEKQLDLNKTILQIKGSAFFSGKTFVKNPLEINQILRNKYYQNPVLPPSTNHKKVFIPESVYGVQLKKQKNKKYRLSWESIPENKEKEAIKFMVYKFDKNEHISTDNSSNLLTITGSHYIDMSKKEYKQSHTFVIQAVSRNNNVSNPVRFVK
ncbi:MAG: family 10 glycosylhydrolase [Flavobacteriaceae bacterium]|nr:family 10 glycosylhydrolase [Flavobacteriaceae bacterium]